MQSWCRERRTFERMVEGAASVVPATGGDEASPGMARSIAPLLKLPWVVSLLDSNGVSKRDVEGWLAVEIALLESRL